MREDTEDNVEEHDQLASSLPKSPICIMPPRGPGVAGRAEELGPGPICLLKYEGLLLSSENFHLLNGHNSNYEI